MNATKAQVRVIHMLKSALRMDDDCYRAALGSYGVTTSLDLPLSRAVHFIERLQMQAISAGVWKYRPEATRQGRFGGLQGRQGMASAAQLRKVEALWVYVSRQPTTEAKREALHVWLEHRFHVARLEWLPEWMVGKVIKALEAMVAQKEARDAAGQDHNQHEEGHDAAVQVAERSSGRGECVPV
jgi:hypothetical protein